MGVKIDASVIRAYTDIRTVMSIHSLRSSLLLVVFLISGIIFLYYFYNKSRKNQRVSEKNEKGKNYYDKNILTFSNNSYIKIYFSQMV